MTDSFRMTMSLKDISSPNCMSVTEMNIINFNAYGTYAKTVGGS